MSEREADVEMKFSVRAREVRLECEPKVEIEVYADSPATAECESSRENLPDQLAPGVTYRDIAVRWRAAARLGEPDWDEAVTDARRARRLPRNGRVDL